MANHSDANAKSRWSRRTAATHLLAWGLGIAWLLAMLAPLPHDWRSGWRHALADLAHLPIFAAATVILYCRYSHPLVRAGWISAGLAVAIECVQPVVGRSFDVKDMFRGVLGSILACGVIVMASPVRGKGRIVGAGIAFAAIAWPIADATPRLRDAFDATLEFPVLCDFRSARQTLRWWTPTCRWIRRPRDEPDPGFEAKLVPTTTSGIADAVLFPVVRDWTGWKRVVWDFTVEGPALPILLSVRDGVRWPPGIRRFDDFAVFNAGRHRVVVGLDDLATGKLGAPLDLRRVQSVHLQVGPFDRDNSIRLHSIHLE